jgi:hypothetical protein
MVAMHTRGGVDGVTAQTLDDVLLGERVVVVRRDVSLELLEGLVAEVAAVHQEQHPPRAGELDEAVDEADGGEGLAAAGGHLHQGAGAIVPEGLLQVGDGPDLGGPQTRLDEGRHEAQAGEKGVGRGKGGWEVGGLGGLRVAAGRVSGVGGVGPRTSSVSHEGRASHCLLDLRLWRGRWAEDGRCIIEPSAQGLGPMEGEDPAGAGLGIEAAGEMGFDPRGLVGKRQGRAPGGEPVWETLGVLGGLDLDAGEGGTLPLGLDDPRGAAVDVEQVVGGAVAGCERELTNRHATAGGDVGLFRVTHQPACCREQAIDDFPRFLFRLRHGVTIASGGWWVRDEGGSGANHREAPTRSGIDENGDRLGLFLPVVSYRRPAVGRRSVAFAARQP